jgi:hypothetical protein
MSESAPKGAPQAGAAKPQTRGDSTPDADSVDDRGFFHKAMSGKVRPAPREPETTHYGCSCCRWSA